MVRSLHVCFGSQSEQFREQLTLGAPNNDHEATLRRLARQIRDGKVRVKLFLRHPLHAKLYLMHRADPNNPTLGLVGSSNPTLALHHQLRHQVPHGAGGAVRGGRGVKPIRLSKHAGEQAVERGATEDEIREAVRHGTREAAKRGRLLAE